MEYLLLSNVMEKYIVTLPLKDNVTLLCDWLTCAACESITNKCNIIFEQYCSYVDFYLTYIFLECKLIHIFSHTIMRMCIVGSYV